MTLLPLRMLCVKRSPRPSCLQMQYSSIGWSVGATLGTCAALGGGDQRRNSAEGAVQRRPVLFCGDGAFQMTAQVWPAWDSHG